MSNYQELINLILHPYESKEIDFKGPLAWNGNDKKACCEIVKDILAMANTKGGFIVIGVEDTKSGFNPKGLTSEQIASFQSEEINRFVQRYAEPPINTTLSKIDYNGKSFVIVSIPQFSSIPHICKTDFPGVLTKPTLYVRTDNNESAPISTTSDFHALIESAISKREQSLLTAFRSILKGYEPDKDQSQTINEQYTSQISLAIKEFEGKNPLKEKNYIGYREIAFCPVSSFDDKRFEIPQLKEAIKKSSVNFKGWPFIFVSRDPKELYAIQNGIESLVTFTDSNNNDRIDFWRLYTSGLFYYRTLMWEESQDRKRTKTTDINYQHSEEYKGSTMDFLALTFYVAEAINSLTILYSALGLNEEPITTKFRVTGTDNRMLTSYNTSRELSMAYIARIPEIVEERTYSLNEWEAGIVDLSIDIIKSICLKFNWDNPSVSVFRKDIEKLFSRKL
jgi:hypothetical protein